MAIEQDLVNAVIDLDENKSYGLVKKMVDDGADPNKIIEILKKGVEEIGERFSRKEYFLTELVMAGEIFQQSAKLLEPILKSMEKASKSTGTVVIGTVKGDVHDIGKNIFVTLLQVGGYEVYDLGVDIEPIKFLEKVKEKNANIVAYSGLLTVALDSMKETTELLKTNGLRDKVKIIIGGLPVDEMWMKEAGADAFTDNAFEGVKIINEWLKSGGG
ncbi:MAG: cobalamin-dependent protein [Candidatus Lokiarchaeota archaeon]|nr:cobalamin-dependent protein [Candidatus Lokiarchaeota archaeon]